MRVHPVADAALGNTSYLVDIGRGQGAVVDPRRDVEEYLATASRHGLQIVAAIETHLHADFVSGALELAEATGADVVSPAAAGAHFDHQGVAGGQVLGLGEVEIRVLATPGHTPEHVAYLVTEDDAAAVFTGGSLIAGGAARTDLVAPELTEHLARAQFHSLRALAALPGGTPIWPTHGAGSFCSAGPSSSALTTIRYERATNPLLAVDDEDEFVARLLAGYGSFPPYFFHLRAVNRHGPPLVRDLAEPRPLDAAEASSLMEDGVWLVDARPVRDWAEGHPRGAVSIALRPAFASWLGWVVPFGARVVLVLDEERVPEALTLARRIGYDAVAGWIDGDVEAWRAAGLPVDVVEEVSAAQAADRAGAGATLVDVRQRSEVEEVRIPGAVHLELGEIAAGKAPDADDVVVFCGHGERSATAASLLERRSLHVVNLDGGISAWEGAGLPVAR